MTAERKYQYIVVYSSVNCSSTGHYSARISYSIMGKYGDAQKYKREWFYIGTHSTLPQYAQDEIFRILRNLYRAGLLRFYENDQDGNARYEDLRYHEPRHFEYMIDYVREEARHALEHGREEAT